jgi:LysM repeat protein
VNNLRDLRANLPTGERLMTLLAIVVIVAVIGGYVVFIAVSILPKLKVRQELSSRLTAAQQNVLDAQLSQGDAAGELRDKLASVEAALGEAASLFFAEAEAADVLNRLYEYASQSGVGITDMQAAEQEEEEEEAKLPYDVRKFQLRVAGPVRSLLHFMSLIKEAANRSLILDNIKIAEEEGQSFLTMDAVLYTSVYATAVETTELLPAATAVALPTGTVEGELEAQLHELWAAEDWPAAILVIGQLLATQPGDADLTGKLYGAHVNYGYRLAAEGELAAARDQFTRALVLNPNGAEAAAGLQEVSGPAPTIVSEYTVHIVGDGETLYSIGRLYGTSVPDIMAANGLTTNAINVGQQLRIPTP